MEIEVWSVGRTKFTADPEFQEPMIREAIDQRGDVADVITDYTDSERSDISYDEYARVTGDVPGLVLFEGWLTGDRNAPPPTGARESHAAAGIPLRSDAETATMLRADLADAEALLARWPRCPGGCRCRVGIPEDADANECGCDGPCNGDDSSGPSGQLHEGDWDDAVSEATS